jgi:hypothetical protein
MLGTGKLTEAFSQRQGEWQVIVDGEVVAAPFNSKGAAEAAIPVERARRARRLTKTCQLCKTEGLTVYIDGATAYGPWASMCETCHELVGRGLGTGRGQKYELRGTAWVKIAG